MSTNTGEVILALGMPGMPELVVIALVGLLIFGKRLPNVARSVGKSIVEFKKGIKDVKDEVDTASSAAGNNHILDSKPTPTLTPPPATQQPTPTQSSQEIIESGE